MGARAILKKCEKVLCAPGETIEVYREGDSTKDPSPLKVKEVWVDERRYIVCVNSRQARKDAQDRQAIIESLKEKIRSGAKEMIGNKGCRRFLEGGEREFFHRHGKG